MCSARGSSSRSPRKVSRRSPRFLPGRLEDDPHKVDRVERRTCRQCGGNVVRHDSPAPGKALECIDHHRLADIVEPKDSKACEDDDPPRETPGKPPPTDEAEGHCHKLVQD